MKIVAQGEQWRKGSGKSPYDAQFWIEKGLVWASQSKKLRVDNVFAEIFGEYTKGMFELFFMGNGGHQVEWDEQAGTVSAELEGLDLEEAFATAVDITHTGEQLWANVS